MNPARCTTPEQTRNLQELPNVGPSIAQDLRDLGIRLPSQLKGLDPYQLYQELCVLTASRQDPCVLDVLISVVRFVETGEAKPWWSYTAERKARGVPCV